MQKKKNIQLLVILLSIIAAITLLQFTGGKTNNLGVKKTIFQLNDQQEITDVYLQSKEVDNHFSFKNGRWVLNERLRLDQSMRDVFFSILSRVEVRKPVISSARDSIISMLKDHGVHARITFGDELIKEYWVAGDKENQISWMLDTSTGQPYQIHIPGYQSYIAGIYKVPENDWRSRFLLNVNFALITQIEMSYPDSGNDLALTFANNFFEVEGISGDSTKIADFLDQVAYLQADQFIKLEELSTSEQNSVKEEKVSAHLRISKSSGENINVTFFVKDENSPFVIAKVDDGSLCLINYDRIKGIFKNANDFE